MKKLVLSSFVLLLFSTAIAVFLVSCQKSTEVQAGTTYPIQGLWTGTYVVSAGGPVPAGTAFFFSFSIYADGTVSYKSKGYYNGSFDYITFADGTWTLTGNTFNFTVTTINVAGGGTQHTQTGTAVFNSSTGTLTNGSINDPMGGTATWSMTRVN